MNSKLTLGLALTVVALFSVGSFANDNTKRADRREARQGKRIEQGINQGSLTKGETKALEKGQEHINKMEEKAKADGTVTPGEKRRLEAAQDRQSKKIYRLKHNGRKADNREGAAKPEDNGVDPAPHN